MRLIQTLSTLSLDHSLVVRYHFSELYRLSSNRSNFPASITFLTQSTNNTNERVDNITLANIIFAIFFDKIAITFENKAIESFTILGVIIEYLAQLLKSEYFERSGELHSLVHD